MDFWKNILKLSKKKLIKIALISYGNHKTMIEFTNELNYDELFFIDPTIPNDKELEINIQEMVKNRKLKLIKQNAIDFEFYNTFDLIIMNNAVHYFPIKDRINLLNSCDIALKDKGKLLIIEPYFDKSNNNDKLFINFQRSIAKIDRSMKKDHFPIIKKSVFSNLIETSNFTKVEDLSSNKNIKLSLQKLSKELLQELIYKANIILQNTKLDKTDLEISYLKQICKNNSFIEYPDFIVNIFNKNSSLEAEQKTIIKKVPEKKDIKFITVDNPKIIFQQSKSFRNSNKEHFVIFLLNIKNDIIKTEQIGMGSVAEIYLLPKDIFRPALINDAHSVILVHNHPSGDTTPSKADINLTKKILQAGDILGIQVLDHIIVSDSNYYSFKEHEIF